MSKQTLILDAVISLQAFETYWAYFSQSNGLLYDKECRQAAKEFCQRFKALIKVDKTSISVKPCSEGIYKENPIEVQSFVAFVDKWSNNNIKPNSGNLVVVRITLSHFSNALKTLWLKELGANVCPLIKWNPVEIEHMEQLSRWLGYFPAVVLEKMHDPLKLLNKASASPTIAVVGDIRKSQDLMTLCSRREFIFRTSGQIH